MDRGRAADRLVHRPLVGGGPAAGHSSGPAVGSTETTSTPPGPARAKGAAPKDAPEVLFVCVHNAGRSEMAAALLHARSGGRVHVRSAGSIPAGQLEPAMVEVMGELGLDLARAFPKPLTDDVVQAADVVVTMGCGDTCPVYPGKRDLDWDLPDPQHRPLAEVRRVRDDIDARVHTLLAELVPTAAAP